MKNWLIIRFIGFWPPFWGTGIRVKKLSKDFKTVLVQMKLRVWNKNAVGTQFGGSLYSMTDPFYMLMLMNILGKEYIVWDKSATITYKKPCRKTVYARFELTDKMIEDIKTTVKEEGKMNKIFTIPIQEEDGVTMAVIEKTLYIRHRSFRK